MLNFSSKLLDKNIQMLCVGKGHLSFLLSLSLLKRGQKVLLLDDPRMSFGESFAYNPRLIEREFLRQFGIDQGVPALINIEQYTHQKPYLVFIENRQLFLGQAPSENLRELWRIFPELFESNSLDFTWLKSLDDRSEFDEMFLATTRRLAASAYQFQGVESLNYELFLTQCPPSLKQIFEVFSQNLHQRTAFDSPDQIKGISPIHQLFLYTFRSHFHHQLSPTVSKLECFHLFLSLLSPQYKLETERLLDELLKNHLERGGQYKMTTIREWKFDSQKPWSVELASFDGIIHPEKMCFFGNMPEPHPFEISPLPSTYSGVRVKWRFDNPILQAWDGMDLFCTRLLQMGTEFPWWQASVKASEIEFHLPISQLRGVKLEFMRHGIRRFLRKELSLLIDMPLKDIAFEEMTESRELWIEPLALNAVQVNKNKDLELYDTSIIGKRTRLKNVSYFGPYRHSELGLFSALMGLREAQHYL